jgi:UDP-N-acetyl-D-glucosamine dehydrogenase
VLIALANSAAVICDGLDMNIDNILKGLQSKIDQFGLKLAKPGIGPGGHCIPEDIHYVIRKARQNGIDTRFLDSAADLNDRMPRYAVHRLQEMIIRSGGRMSESKIALLGMAYKENIDDSRRSPSVEVAYQLVRYSKQVNIHDPFVPKSALESIKGAVVFSSLNEALKNADGVFLGTAHDVYKQTITADVLRKYGIKYVLDGRNCLDKSSIIKSGIAYHGIGR